MLFYDDETTEKNCTPDVDITAIAVFLTLTSLGDHPSFQIITVNVGLAVHNCCIVISSLALISPNSL